MKCVIASERQSVLVQPLDVLVFRVHIPATMFGAEFASPVVVARKVDVAVGVVAAFASPAAGLRSAAQSIVVATVVRRCSRPP